MTKKLKGFRAIKTGNKTHYYFDDNRRKANITESQFQFVSLRHKHATDIANKLGIEQARLSLNHSDKKMTEVYIKNAKGMKVDPI